MKNLSQTAMGNVTMGVSDMPSESLKFALCVVAAGPMLVVFPLLPEVFFAGSDYRSGKGVTA